MDLNLNFKEPQKMMKYHLANFTHYENKKKNSTRDLAQTNLKDSG